MRTGAEQVYSTLNLEPGGTSAGQTGQLQFSELVANGTNLIGFKAPDSIATSVIWTLPSTDGTASQFLQTNGAGILSWAYSAPISYVSTTATVTTSSTTYSTISTLSVTPAAGTYLAILSVGVVTSGGGNGAGNIGIAVAGTNQANTIRAINCNTTGVLATTILSAGMMTSAEVTVTGTQAVTGVFNATAATIGVTNGTLYLVRIA